MKTLTTSFLGRGSQKGFEFLQVKREKSIAIFSKSDKQVTYFEVVDIKKHNGYKLGGINFPPAETYPGDNAFGVSAWCCSDITRAELKFNELLNKNENEN